MKAPRHIPWFNPREMEDATVLALNTGRAALLAEVRHAIEERVRYPGQFVHWLLTGPRGAGKSFFLRLLQADLRKEPIPGIRFVLLPEELPNIYAPHELLLEITRLLEPGQKNLGSSPRWRVDESGKLWDEALASLCASVGETLLVVGIENFDTLIAQAFSSDVDNSRLRHLMSTESRIMFVATAVQGDFDEKHHQRLFRQFEHRSLPRWNSQDHRHYLHLRAAQQGSKPSSRQLNRIDAYSRYTGGNPRAAAVLAATILDTDDLLQGADDLDAAVEKMSDYYRALIERIPVNTKKLFDALVRGGEPASQTELAKRTGARQSDISRAFAWLVDNGYVSEERQMGESTKQYRVIDRLLVQFYHMRYLHPGQRSRLAIMADLLADMLSFQDKWHYACRYVDGGQDAEAQTLAELALKERGIDIGRLPESMQQVRQLTSDVALWAQHDKASDAAVAAKAMPAQGGKYADIFEQFPNDAQFKAALDHAYMVANAVSVDQMQGNVLAPLVRASLSLSPVEKYRAYVFMASTRRTGQKWVDLEQVFLDEAKDFNRLERLEAKEIAELRELCTHGLDFPMTASFHGLAAAMLRGGLPHNLAKVSLAVAAMWAARAAVGWRQAGLDSYVARALDMMADLCDKSFKVEFAPTMLYQALEMLEPLMPFVSINLRLRNLALRGIVLEQLGRNDAAYQIHYRAREDALQIMAQNPEIDYRWRASWNLEKMAWNSSAMGKTEQSIEHHQRAITEWLEQDRPEKLAWSLGQIARHRIAQTDVATSWQELELALSKYTTDTVWAIRQLGDAVADCVAKNGITQAFAMGLEILQGLAQRPQFPAEAILRGLWIDMLEMGVPIVLLRDLLGEWPRWWPEASYPDLQQLAQLLQAFLGYLEATPAEREATLKSADTDLANTLAELEKALPVKTRHRFGLSGDNTARAVK